MSWFDNSTLKHLRFPFSFYLMPVFLFALSQAKQINLTTTLLGFAILHFFLFPSSNGYNSFQDKDKTSIGGLKYPPAVTRNLFWVTLFMDILAVVCSLFVSVYLSLLVLGFILMSRIYSYRGVRLKKFPFLGFFTVFIFQGGYVYLISSVFIMSGLYIEWLNIENITGMVISSLFIGSMYPLTQIYQHEADRKDGVISISYKLGYIGTFVFSAVLFVIATILMGYHFINKNEFWAMALFLLMMFPVIVHLGRWFSKVRKDVVHASYENTMATNLLVSVCMNLYFVFIILINHFSATSG